MISAAVLTPTCWPFPTSNRAERQDRPQAHAPEVWYRHLETIRTARLAAEKAAHKGQLTRAAEHAARIQQAAAALAAMFQPEA
jgi:hypothetical protein